jgi:hypothetical protein
MINHLPIPPSKLATPTRSRCFKNGAPYDSRGRTKDSVHRAGGYRIAEGCRRYPNFRPGQRRPWLTVVKLFIKKKLKAGDLDTRMMLMEAECDFLTFEAMPLHHHRGTPLSKAQSLIANILKQGRQPVDPSQKAWRRSRYTTVDILSAAMAADLMVAHSDKTPLRTPHYRAVQIGKAIGGLLRQEIKVYEQESMRFPGRVLKTVVRHKPRLRSRYACQRLQQITEKHYGPFLEQYGPEIAAKVLTRALS